MIKFWRKDNKIFQYNIILVPYPDREEIISEIIGAKEEYDTVMKKLQEPINP